MDQDVAGLRRAVEYGLANGKTNLIADLATLKQLFDELHQWRQGDPTGDLIHANRDAILEKHEEAVRLISGVIAQSPKSFPLDRINGILNALNMFHPMHAESWCGWPILSYPEQTL